MFSRRKMYRPASRQAQLAGISKNGSSDLTSVSFNGIVIAELVTSEAFMCFTCPQVNEIADSLLKIEEMKGYTLPVSSHGPIKKPTSSSPLRLLPPAARATKLKKWKR